MHSQEDFELLHFHVTAEEVALFVAGRLDQPDLRRFLQQVARPCPLCRGKLRFYVPPPEAGLERHIALWAEEQAGLARLRKRGGSEPFDGRYARFTQIARKVHGWARIEHLIELSRTMRHRNPGQMWLLAQGAASVASTLGSRTLDRGRYTEAQKADLRARTQIELADAYRLNLGFAGAEECLEKAAALVEEGRCSPRTRGRLMDVYASVLMDRRQPGAAYRLLDRLC